MIWRRFVVWSIIIIILVSILSTQIASASTSTSASIFKKSRSAYDNGNYTSAFFYLKQALNSDPNNVSILTDLGNTLANLWNYSGATIFFKKALSLDPHHKGAILGLGEIMNLIGNSSESMMYFKKVLSTKCTSSTIICNEDDAIALTRLHKYRMAMLAINHVLKELPTYIDALNTCWFSPLFRRNVLCIIFYYNNGDIITSRLLRLSFIFIILNIARLCSEFHHRRFSRNDINCSSAIACRIKSIKQFRETILDKPF